MFKVQQSASSPEEMKWQPLIVTARKSQIESCTVGLEIDSKRMHLMWPYPEVKIDLDQITIMPIQSSMPLNPDDPVQLIIWYALKVKDGTKEKEKFYLVTDSIIGLDLGPHVEPLEMRITFYSKEGQVNKRPFRFLFHAGSWERLSLEMVAD